MRSVITTVLVVLLVACGMAPLNPLDKTAGLGGEYAGTLRTKTPGNTTEYKRPAGATVEAATTVDRDAWMNADWLPCSPVPVKRASSGLILDGEYVCVVENTTTINGSSTSVKQTKTITRLDVNSKGDGMEAKATWQEKTESQGPGTSTSVTEAEYDGKRVAGE